MAKSIIYLFFTVMACLTVKGQQTQIAAVEKGMAGLLPQQKVYLHLDKDEYYAGDIMWFKAYIVDANTHKPDTAETTLYVDIFNTTGGLLHKKILQVNRGYTHGDFTLNDSIAEGNYSIRAYTSWMLNFDREFVFEQLFFLNNPIEEKIISRGEARQNRRNNRELSKQKDQYQTEFFPEGGQIIEGIPNRVGFFASNLLGEGIKVTGHISDNEGNRISTIETIHQGKGVFEFTPERRKRYSVSIKYPNGRSINYPIRSILREGMTLRVDTDADAATLTINQIWQGNEIPAYMNSPFLVLHKRGSIIKMLNLSSSEYPKSIKITKEELPLGVIVATLFDSNAQVMAERLFFVKPEAESDIEITLEKRSETFHDLKLQFKDFVTDSAAYSVSVTATNQTPGDTYSNIFSNLYLTSDILYSVQNPLGYMHGDDNISRADLLMLVSSWQRFTWNEVRSGEDQKAEIPRDSGFPVYGIIKPTVQSRKTDLTDFEITLKFEEDGRVFITRTDNEGNFRFEGFDQTGDYEAEITLLGIRGSSPESFEMFPDRLDNEDRGFNFYSRKLIDRGTLGWRWRSQQRAGTSDRFIKLHDETRGPGYGSPDQIIYLKENDLRYQNMRDVLIKNVSGVIVDGFSILIRGRSSINLTNQPLIMIDGIQYSSRQFLLTPPVEISHIEVYKGSSASIFGLRGANGAIVAYSRRGNNPERIVFKYLLEGYYEPRIFANSDAELKDLFFEDKQYKQTVFWRHYIRINENGNAVLRIPTEKIPPYMTVTIEGVDQEGNVVHTRQVFQPAGIIP